MPSTAQIVHDKLREKIIAKHYAPGTRLGTAELAEQLGVSRTPIREALYMLQAEGLVRIKTNQGAFVVGWTIDEIRQIFALRAQLESFACQLAVDNFSASNIRLLNQYDQEMRQLLQDKNNGYVAAIKELNAKFHSMILDAARNGRLADFVRNLSEVHLITATFENYTAEEFERSMMHHSELVLAFRKNDGRWASAVMYSHIIAAEEIITRSGLV